jgi:hypothetical protein
VTIQYNLCNEPWLKYSMAAVADRGLKASQWTSARLRNEVLYLETHKQRFELSRVDAAAPSSGSETSAVSAAARLSRAPSWTQGNPPVHSLTPLEPMVAMHYVRNQQRGRHVLRMHFFQFCLRRQACMVWQGEVFRWARCRQVLPQERLRKIGLPLPDSHLHVLEPALAWEDLQVCVDNVYLNSQSSLLLHPIPPSAYLLHVHAATSAV